MDSDPFRCLLSMCLQKYWSWYHIKLKKIHTEQLRNSQHFVKCSTLSKGGYIISVLAWYLNNLSDVW